MPVDDPGLERTTEVGPVGLEPFERCHGSGSLHTLDDTRAPRVPVTMRAMEIHFLGGATTVTGSQYLLDDRAGQGPHRLRDVPGEPERVDPQPRPVRLRPGELDAVLLTHAHLDHCGLLPLLVKAGYRGPIHATPGTIELATLVLLDSGKLHEEFAKREARWEKRHPDEAAADDRKEADEYAAAIALAEAEDNGQHVETTVEPVQRPDRSGHAGRATPRRSCARSRRHLLIDLDEPLYTAKDAERSLASFRPVALRRGDRGRARRPRHCSSTPATSWARRSSGCGSSDGRAARSGSSSAPATSVDPARRSCATRRR